MSIIRKFLNLPLYYFRENHWRIHPARWKNLGQIPIHKPIFLLGLQGGGLPLISRMLRRHPQTVSVTGNHKFWAGQDEMQNVMGDALPPKLTGLHSQAPYHPTYARRDGVYAIDDLLPLYRETENSFSIEIKNRFEHLIRLAIAMHAPDKQNARFIDKSQTVTVRLSFVNSLIADRQPFFLLITRNPYALCYRYATRIRSLTTLDLTLKERLQLAGQHWSNSMKCALEDAQQVRHFKIVAFEQLLTQPHSNSQFGKSLTNHVRSSISYRHDQTISPTEVLQDNAGGLG